MNENNDDIKRYRDGNMTSAERHALEKKALNDPFLAEALEGAETISEREFSSDVEALLRKIRTDRRPWLTPLRVAAGVILILTVGSLGYYLNPDEPVQSAGLGEKGLMTSDSVAAAIKPDTTGAMIAMAKDDATAEESKETLEPATPSTTQPATPATTEPTPVTKQLAISSTTKSPSEQAGPPAAKAEVQPAEIVKTENERAEPVATLAEDQGRASGLKKAAVPERTLAMKDFVPQRIIRGTVKTEEEGTPLPGVNIAIKGTTRGTVTDLHGNYSLALPADPVTLSYSFIGMETKEIKPGYQLMLNVDMKADAVQLSEVMIVGQSQLPDDRDDLTKPVVRLAAPVGGIRAYNEYLETSLQYPPEALARKIKGKVIITFTVGTTGSLSDFNVVRGLGYGCEEEVMRLVKEGADWTPSYEDDIPVESEVRVKLKFDPEKANK